MTSNDLTTQLVTMVCHERKMHVSIDGPVLIGRLRQLGLCRYHTNLLGYDVLCTCARPSVLDQTTGCHAVACPQFFSHFTETRLQLHVGMAKLFFVSISKHNRIICDCGAILKGFRFSFRHIYYHLTHTSFVNREGVHSYGKEDCSRFEVSDILFS